jgi:hypothetical protein
MPHWDPGLHPAIRSVSTCRPFNTNDLSFRAHEVVINYRQSVCLWYGWTSSQFNVFGFTSSNSVLHTVVVEFAMPTFLRAPPTHYVSLGNTWRCIIHAHSHYVTIHSSRKTSIKIKLSCVQLSITTASRYHRYYISKETHQNPKERSKTNAVLIKNQCSKQKQDINLIIIAIMIYIPTKPLKYRPHHHLSPSPPHPIISVSPFSPGIPFPVAHFSKTSPQLSTLPLPFYLPCASSKTAPPPKSPPLIQDA